MKQNVQHCQYNVVNSSLVVDAAYSVLVEFDTLAGNVSSNTVPLVSKSVCVVKG